MEYIDLRSDTVTKPTPEMREAMAEAEVGDDVYRDDPTVNRLEGLAAEMLGKEAALFVPSGTMGNLIALLVHCQRGHEVIVGSLSHIYLNEVGGMSALGGIQACPVQNRPDGTLGREDILASIRSVADIVSDIANASSEQAAGIDQINKALAQMDEVTLDLRLARATQIGRRNRDIDERVAAEHDVMRADDLAVLERERVERSAELVHRHDERRRHAAPLPVRRQARACFEIAHRDRVDQRQAGERRVLVALDAGAVGDDGSKTAGEDVGEIRDERSGGGPPRLHGAILVGSR